MLRPILFPGRSLNVQDVSLWYFWILFWILRMDCFYFWRPFLFRVRSSETHLFESSLPGLFEPFVPSARRHVSCLDVLFESSFLVELRVATQLLAQTLY